MPIPTNHFLTEEEILKAEDEWWVAGQRRLAGIPPLDHASDHPNTGTPTSTTHELATNLADEERWEMGLGEEGNRYLFSK